MSDKKRLFTARLEYIQYKAVAHLAFVNKMSKDKVVEIFMLSARERKDPPKKHVHEVGHRRGRPMGSKNMTDGISFTWRVSRAAYEDLHEYADYCGYGKAHALRLIISDFVMEEKLEHLLIYDC